MKHDADAVLTCAAKGNPAPKIRWSHPNNSTLPIEKYPYKFTLTEEHITSDGDGIRGHVVVSKLTITKANSFLDYGTYTCTSYNGVGEEDEVIIHLSGSGK